MTAIAVHRDEECPYVGYGSDSYPMDERCTCAAEGREATPEQREEWAVRWPAGEVEECRDLAHAQQIVRLYAEPVLLRRVITVGPWESPPARGTT